MESAVKKEDEEQHASSIFDLREDLMTMVLPDDVVLDHLDDQSPTGEILSPITAQIFDFCDDELFPAETLTTSEAASCSNCCHDENSYYSAGVSLPQDTKFITGYDDIDINTASATTAATVATASAAANDINCSNLSMIFDPQEDIDNSISASINFSPCRLFSVPQYLASASQGNQFDISQIQSQVAPPSDPLISDGVTHYPTQVIGPLMATHPLPPVFEDECLSAVPSFVRVNHSSSAAPTCTLLDLSLGPYLLNNLSPTLSAADSFVGSNLFMGSEIPQPQTLGYQEDCNSYYCPDSTHRGFYSGGIQSLCGERARQWMSSGSGNPNPSVISEITSIEEPSYKVGKLSVEQRKEKIHRYLGKKNERNFSKKIKYACRKTLADSRPRVRGRFARNDEYGSEQSYRATYSHHEDDEITVAVEGEYEILSTSDLFSHSFNYNVPVQESWT